MRHRVVRTAIFVILLGLIGLSGWKIWELQAEYKAGNDEYEEIGQLVVVPSAPPIPKEIKVPVSQETPPEEVESSVIWPEADFEALHSINSDIVAWIYLEGTEINYPIVQGKDNSYYLTHLFSGERNSSGCIFLDYRNAKDLSDTHSVVYGHHMKNGTMFSGLDNYKKQSYYDEHPTALLLTPENNYQILFFAGYVASVQDDAWKIGFSSDEFENWCAKAIDRSCFQSDVVPVATDRVITLSTCSYEFDNARFVLLGIIVES